MPAHADGRGRIRAAQEQQDPGLPSRSRAGAEGARTGMAENKESGQR
ncbi:hypothetical protein GA0115239_12644 [Streptomyces sp. BpilaLS-43]|nr:hypothetical protein [Streptomyces sp. BpilaLS-43]SCE16478.1 hypothetical protein GA0115239_12644 [Streptomyces sp. BpilaLS-43]